MTTRETFEWRVTWQRSGWKHSQTRIYGRRPDADNHVARLRSGDRPDLAPLVELTLSKRPVGAWVAVGEPVARAELAE